MTDVSPPEFPLLLLDAACPTVVVGLQAAADEPAAWRETTDEAGIGLSRLTDELLRARGLTVDSLRTVVWCEGPGSLLGIRLAAMMLRTWMALPRPAPLRVLGYRSLALVAADLLTRGEQPPFHVCSDARRQTWNVLSVAVDGSFAPIRRGTGDDVAALTGGVFHPGSFPHWQPLPAGARAVPYAPARVMELAPRFRLWHECPAPDAFMTEQPTYRTWSPTPP